MTKTAKFPAWEDMILFQDDYFTVVNKPAGLSTLEDRSSPIDLLQLARRQNPKASPAHRLDKETTGALVIANHEEAYRYFAGILEKRQVKKIYHAVVDGLQSFQNFEANEPLYSTGTKTRVDREGKPALTLIQTLEVYKKHSLLKCFPFTGRMHQIRVHLAHHGASIVGDVHYGGKEAYLSELKRNFNVRKDEEESPMIRRLALHAFSLTFMHPITEKEVTIEAPYPKDFNILVKQLRKFS